MLPEKGSIWLPLMGPHAVSGLAGLAVGAVTVFSIGLVDLPGAAVVLFLGAASASAMTRRWTAVITASLVVWLFSAIVTPLLAPVLEGENSYASVGDMLRGALVVCGWLLVGIAHVSGIAFREERVRAPVRVLAILSGVIASVLLVISLVILPPPTTAASFQISVPPHWTVMPPNASNSEAWRYRPDYCNDYAATTGTDLSATATGVFAAPTVCAVVVRFDPNVDRPGAAEACYYGLSAWIGSRHPLYSWHVSETPSSPPISGAYEEVRVNDKGDTIYGLGLDRIRSLDGVRDHVCYIVSLTVPHDANLAAADVNGILSTFRFR